MSFIDRFYYAFSVWCVFFSLHLPSSLVFFLFFSDSELAISETGFMINLNWWIWIHSHRLWMEIDQLVNNLHNLTFFFFNPIFTQMDSMKDYHKEFYRAITYIQDGSSRQLIRKHTKCWLVRTRMQIRPIQPEQSNKVESMVVRTNC